MSPVDTGNLIWNTLDEVRTPVTLFLLVYGTLVILLPFIEDAQKRLRRWRDSGFRDPGE